MLCSLAASAGVPPFLDEYPRIPNQLRSLSGCLESTIKSQVLEWNLASDDVHGPDKPGHDKKVIKQAALDPFRGG